MAKLADMSDEISDAFGITFKLISISYRLQSHLNLHLYISLTNKAVSFIQQSFLLVNILL